MSSQRSVTLRMSPNKPFNPIARKTRSGLTAALGMREILMKSLWRALFPLLAVMLSIGCVAAPKPKGYASVFTLECTGTRKSKDPAKSESVSRIYSFELDAAPARYFDWTAKRWIQMKSQNDQLLVLKFDMKMGARLEDIDRTNGRWSETFAVPNFPEYSISGVCSKIEHESPPNTTPRIF